MASSKMRLQLCFLLLLSPLILGAPTDETPTTARNDSEVENSTTSEKEGTAETVTIPTTTNSSSENGADITTEAPVTEISEDEDEGPCAFRSGGTRCYAGDISAAAEEMLSPGEVEYLELNSPPTMKNLTAKDLEPFTKIHDLVIVNSTIETLEEGLFSNSTLAYLDFEGPLHFIPAGLLNNSKITKLKLKNITGLIINEQSPFLVSDQLTALVLERNKIKALYSQSLQLPQLKSLTIIEKSNVSLKLSPEVLKNSNVSEVTLKASLDVPENTPLLISTTLTSLELENTGIKKFDSAKFQDLPNLEDLQLSEKDGGSTTISPDAINKTNVESLKMVNISLVPTEQSPILISGTLKTLRIAESGIKKIFSETFQELKVLKKLTLSESQISYVNLQAADFLQSTEISSLVLQNVIFNVTGNKVFTSDKLTELVLQNNEVSNLPEILKQLPNLQKLTISEKHGKNVTIPADMLNGTKVTSLRFLNVSIKFPDDKPFIQSAILEDLVLRKAQIKSIPINAFASLPELEKVDLSGNELEVLPEGLFKNNLELKEVDLSQNRLNSVTLAVFGDDLQYRKVFMRVDYNRWECGCNMYSFMQYVLTYGDSDNVSCDESQEDWMNAVAKNREKCDI